MPQTCAPEPPAAGEPLAPPRPPAAPSPARPPLPATAPPRPPAPAAAPALPPGAPPRPEAPAGPPALPAGPPPRPASLPPVAPALPGVPAVPPAWPLAVPPAPGVVPPAPPAPSPSSVGDVQPAAARAQPSRPTASALTRGFVMADILSTSDLGRRDDHVVDPERAGLVRLIGLPAEVQALEIRSGPRIARGLIDAALPDARDREAVDRRAVQPEAHGVGGCVELPLDAGPGPHRDQLPAAVDPAVARRTDALVRVGRLVVRHQLVAARERLLSTVPVLRVVGLPRNEPAALDHRPVHRRRRRCFQPK